MEGFCPPVFKLTDPFLGGVPSTDEPSTGVLRFCSCVLLLAFSFDSFLECHLLLTLPICSFLLPTFCIRALNILIIVILNSLPDNSNICVTCESGSDDLFGHSACVFPCFSARLAILCGEPGMLHRVQELKGGLSARMYVNLERSWTMLMFDRTLGTRAWGSIEFFS